MLLGLRGSFAKWAEEHPRLVTALAAVAGAVAAVLLGLLAFSVAVSTVKYVVASIKLFKAAMQGAQIATKVMAGAQAALNFVMSMNPIALVIIGVMALIAALIYLYNNSETVRNFIDWAAQSIATAWNTAVTSISETVAEAAVWISSQWQYICDTADSAWNAITSTIQSVWETVYSVVDEGVQWVQNKWEQLKGVFSSPITTAIKFITSSSSNENPDRNAYGGLITRPTLSWVGEAGDPEMIVPINRTQNAMRLWQSAGQMLGVEALQPVRDPAPLLGSRGTGVTVNFAPTIQVSGEPQLRIRFELYCGNRKLNLRRNSAGCIRRWCSGKGGCLLIKRYTTIQGDMWDFIAFKIYGSERFMDALLEANPDHAETIVLPAGIELDCPEVSRNAPRFLPPWKEG